ncbi:hypothetical protein H6G81_33220, partial [Scytonema hofmannii FACHB-248]|nr:hypothetical protein [Scytonema hofmannii FACHB-248]
LPNAHCPLPIAHCPLPNAHCPLPIAHCPKINKELLQSITRSQHDPGRSVTMP